MVVVLQDRIDVLELDAEARDECDGRVQTRHERTKLVKELDDLVPYKLAGERLMLFNGSFKL